MRLGLQYFKLLCQIDIFNFEHKYLLLFVDEGFLELMEDALTHFLKILLVLLELEGNQLPELRIRTNNIKGS